ncbi:MAG: translation elongation factor Ts [Oscillospiraceae bacterium]|jgi:elongation factor Ts|nr:translation elongation factor Ts [Oscillospiraceae bacterium]
MCFTPQDVVKLRQKTGCGMMDCKNALKHSSGNMEAAIDFLRERGHAVATKKAGRAANEGSTFAIAENGIGVIIEINSETDFGANSKVFQDFILACARIVINAAPSNLEELLDSKDDSGKSIKDLLSEKILEIGENINIRRFARLTGLISSYVHAGGKIAVLVNFSGDISLNNDPDFISMSRDVAMHVAASNPKYINIESVDSETLAREKKILHEQIGNSGKPPAIIEKIISGKINKFYKEICLLEQAFVKDPEITVSEYINNFSKSHKTQISIVDFKRFERMEK